MYMRMVCEQSKSTEMQASEIQALLSEAEARYAVKIFDNIDRRHLAALPLDARCRIVGRALMERCDLAGYRLGRKVLRAAGEFRSERLT
jgi:hypothetical protein